MPMPFFPNAPWALKILWPALLVVSILSLVTFALHRFGPESPRGRLRAVLRRLKKLDRRIDRTLSFLREAAGQEKKDPSFYARHLKNFEEHQRLFEERGTGWPNIRDKTSNILQAKEIPRSKCAMNEIANIERLMSEAEREVRVAIISCTPEFPKLK